MVRDQRVVFFDVGNVLIDDDPFICEIFRLIHQSLPAESPKARPERFLTEVERTLRSHGHEAIERLGFRYYGRTWPKLRKKIRKEVSRHWWLYARVVPKARTVLGALRDEYRLGVIANQPPQVVDRLNQSGLLGLFDVVLLDSQYGVAKPDPALFRLAMEQARVDPEESLMVGDRLDNDVIPARRLGMRAVLLWLNVRDKDWRPQSEWERTFWGILERLPLPRWDDLPPNERPMAVVRCWDEMPAALNKVWAIRV